MSPNTFDKLSMSGKVAVVTGGTQGLGEAVAHLFADRGAHAVVICGRNRDNGEAVRAALEAKGAKALYVEADLAQVEDARSVVAAADRAFGRVDALVNAAAVTDRGTIFDTSPELFDRIFAVNVRAPFFLIQEAAKLMRREGTKGTIVNIISIAGHGGHSFITAYCASKGALITLTKNSAFGVMRHGIRVNGLCIGWMDTPGEDRIMRTFHGATDGWREEAESNLPMGRLVKPDEVARACAYLSTEESGLMTGSIIDFDQVVIGCFERGPQPLPLGEA
jgi:NAD(P)-dependent dehydrogenase (short-subunit alcohol dehydrogenase family)